MANKKNHVYLWLVIGVVVLLSFGAILIKPKPKLVSVEYKQGPVDISKFKSFDTQKSSFIEGVWYNPSDGYMVIKLSDKYYQYCDFPEGKWVNFSKSDSLGIFYNSTIKGGYPCDPSRFQSGDYCLGEGIFAENNYLRSLGYRPATDKSWQDSNGDYPTAEIDNEAEKIMNQTYSGCLDSFAN